MRLNGVYLAAAASVAFFASAAESQVAPAVPTIVSTADLGPVHQRADIIVRDGGVSIPLPGRSLWIFSDTGTGAVTSAGPTPGTQHFVSNSASTMARPARKPYSLDRDYLAPSGSFDLFVPFSADEVAFTETHKPAKCSAGTGCGQAYAIWPGGAAVSPTTGRVYVNFLSFTRGGGASEHPKIPGISVGEVDASGWPRMTRPLQGTDPQHPTLLWSGSKIQFGGSMFVKDGYLYQYGEDYTRNGAKDIFNHAHEYLARVKEGSFTDLRAWQYYAGAKGWSHDVKDAKELFVSIASNFASIYYNSYLHLWMAAYLHSLDAQAYYRVAAAPEGPWSDEAMLYKAPAPTSSRGMHLDYALRAHPELSPDGGKTMYFSVSRDVGTISGQHLDGQDLPFEEVVFGPSRH